MLNRKSFFLSLLMIFSSSQNILPNSWFSNLFNSSLFKKIKDNPKTSIAATVLAISAIATTIYVWKNYYSDSSNTKLEQDSAIKENASEIKEKTEKQDKESKAKKDEAEKINILELHGYLKTIETFLKNFANKQDWQELADVYCTWMKKLTKFSAITDEQLKAKVQKHQDELKKIYSQGPWKAGREVLQSLSDDYIAKISTNPEIHLTAITNLFWYFYAFAASKGNGFDDGEIDLTVSDDRILKFLKSYKYNEQPELTYEHVNTAQFAIQASRFNFLSNKPNLLFGADTANSLFLKPKNKVITNSLGLIRHGVGSLFSWGMSWVRTPQLRVDRIPSAVLHSWEYFIREYKSTTFSNALEYLNRIKDFRPQELQDGEKGGMQKMMEIFKSESNRKLFADENSNRAQLIAKQAFLASIEPYRDIDSRQNRIVNIDLTQMTQFEEFDSL